MRRNSAAEQVLCWVALFALAYLVLWIWFGASLDGLAQ